ncbi:MAG: hypothetical protein ABWK00_06660 [Desulfurococcaceae archaeon]
MYTGDAQLSSAKDELRKLRDELEGLLGDVERLLGEGKAEEALARLRKGIDDLTRRLEGLVEELERGGIGTTQLAGILREALRGVERMIEMSVEAGAKAVEETKRLARSAFEEVERGLGEIAAATKRLVSARIPEEDLKLIDELVRLGVFRTRSEAVSYFVRRGIEASRELIQKAVEELRSAEEVREKVRKEFMKR